MSLYAQYIKEREDFDIIESDKGFATYKINPPEVYLRDLYVKPDYRQSDCAARLATEVASIALDQGCTIMTGSVMLGTKGADDNTKWLLQWGFKMRSANSNFLIFEKGLI